MEKSRNPKLPGKIQEKHTVGRRDLFKGAAAGAAVLVGARAGGSALVKGVAGGAAALVASGAGTVLADGVHGPVPVYDLTGDDTLTVSPVAWPIGGGMTADAWAYGVNGGPPSQVPGPTLRATPGQSLKITVQNDLPVPTTVHFHGVHPILNSMDGVGGVTQTPILPGGSFTHTFTAPMRAGTYAYHAHTDTPIQLPRGLYGLFVVEDGTRQGAIGWDYEYPLVLSTFARDMFRPRPRQDDVQLINGRTFAYSNPLDVASDPHAPGRLVFPMNVGDHVLFRVMNFSNEPHPMHTHGMCYHVEAADAWDLGAHHFQRDTLGVLPGERYDFIAHPEEPGLWLFHCHNLDHVLEGMIAVNVVS